MRRAWEWVRRVVSHPAITFGSNVQFLVGAGLLVAALVSGFLAVLVEFPLVFLILVGVGAFLTTVAGLRMLLPSATPPQADSKTPGFWTDAMQQGLLQEEEERKRNLRQSLQLVFGEVQYNWGLIERACVPKEVEDTQLKIGEWSNRHQGLAAEPGFVDAVRASEAAFEAFEHRRDFSEDQIKQRCMRALKALDGAIRSLES